MPLVSIVIPTYNRAHLLLRAVRSALAQTYQNIEVIIVDDGSTDNTQEIVKSFDDPRVQYMRQDKNRGVCAARNAGIRRSKGKYIAFLDSDDEYLPEKIRKSVEVFKSSSKDVGFVASNFWRVIDGKKDLGAYKRSPLLPWGVYAREVFDKIGMFDESFQFCSDLDLSTRFVCSSFLSKIIDEPLVVYYFTQGSLCTDFKMERSIEIKKAILQNCAPALAKGVHSAARRQLARINYFLGKDLLHVRRPQEARGYFLKAFLLDPLQIEYAGKFLYTCCKN